MTLRNVGHAKRGSDGMAIIGRTLYDLRGIRFDEGEEGNEPPAETGAEETVTPDVSAYEAKITELTAALLAKDDEIAVINGELVKSKAVNYDLLMAVPSTEEVSAPDDNGIDEGIGFDDLFEKEDN